MTTFENGRTTPSAEPAQPITPKALRSPRLLCLSELRRQAGLGRSEIHRRIGKAPAPRSPGDRAAAWLNQIFEGFMLNREPIVEFLLNFVNDRSIFRRPGLTVF